MTDLPTNSVPAVHAPLVPPAASAEPDEPRPPTAQLDGTPLRQYFVWFTIASMTLPLIAGAVSSILIPNQIQALEVARWFTGSDAGVDLTALQTLRDTGAAGSVVTADQQRLLDLYQQFDVSRARAASLVAAVGAGAALVVALLVGVLSDRTRSRRGRRAPWILYGAIACACFLAGMPFAPTIVVMALLWAVVQAAGSSAAGTLSTTVADRVPQARLGLASALGGLGGLVGNIVGTIVAGLAFASLGFNLYYIFAALIAVGGISFVVRAKDRPSTDLPVAPFNRRAFLRGFLVPLRDHDYRLVWIAALVLWIGNATSGALSFFMMQSYITPALSAAEATRLVPALFAAAVPGTLIATAVAGGLSDRVGRRKPFVIASSLLMALGMAVPLLWPVLPALFIQTMIAGVAFGTFIPVDGALFIDVLPDKNAAGRDLSISRVPGSIGSALGPIVAGQVLALTGSYRMIWVVAMLLVVVAAFTIVPVKRAR